MRAAEKRMPYFLCRKLPLTSLGELQNAPKQNASPTSKYPSLMPRTIGTVTAMAIRIALEKLVLFKNRISSLPDGKVVGPNNFTMQLFSPKDTTRLSAQQMMPNCFWDILTNGTSQPFYQTKNLN